MQAGSPVAAAALILAGAAIVLARSDGGRRAAAPTSVSDTAAASALFAAVRGVNPLACSLIGNALENRWGHPSVGGPDVSLLDSTQATYRAWATSNDAVEDMLPTVRRMMADPDPCVRRVAGHLAGRARSVNLAAALAAELSSSSAETREAAVLAVGYSAQTAGASALAAHASDASANVRRLVAWALGRTENRSAAKALIDMLRDGDGLVRVNAALALGSLGTRDAIPALTKMLASDADPRARRAAAAALGQMN
jgi:hypothetical protein